MATRAQCRFDISGIVGSCYSQHGPMPHNDDDCVCDPDWRISAQMREKYSLLAVRKKLT